MPGAGEQAGTWGTTLNGTIGTLLEHAIAGTVTISMSNADFTLSTANGTTDQARYAVIVLTGALTATRNLIIPNVQKKFCIVNSTTGGQSVVVKTSAGTGPTLPNGYGCVVVCNGAGLTVQVTPSYTPGTDAVFSSAANFTTLGATGAVAFTTNPTVAGNALWHAGNFNPASYNAALGYTPVQQGTGILQLNNLVKLGWSSGSRLKATVDTTDLGNIAFDSHLANYLPLGGGTLSGGLLVNSTAYISASLVVGTTLAVGGALTVTGTSGLQGITGTTCTLSSVLTCYPPRGGGGLPGRAMVDNTNTFGAWGWNGGGGNIAVDVGGVAYTITPIVSDITKKRDITPAQEPALPLIRQIEFIDYRYKGDAFGAPPETVMPLHRGGVSAQQLRTLRQEWVQENENGPLQPNVLLLLTNAMKAIQELDAEVQSLRAEVAALRS